MEAGDLPESTSYETSLIFYRNVHFYKSNTYENNYKSREAESEERLRLLGHRVTGSAGQ